MYINNQKRKLDPRDLDTIQNADYFTCIYYRPQGRKMRSEFKTYSQAYFTALQTLKHSKTSDEILQKRKFMFYAVKGTSQVLIGGLK
tara:strand:- start:478 stop:738 length:261 start_codon:yes stop_codon:yes gene_type:complete